MGLGLGWLEVTLVCTTCICMFVQTMTMSITATVRHEQMSEAFLDMLALHHKLMTTGKGDLQVNLTSNRESLVSIKVGFGKDQEFELVCDTGSSNTWVTGVACESQTCQTHPRYDPSKSKSFKNLSKEFPETVEITFGTGKMTAEMHQEMVSIGGLDGIKIPDQKFLMATEEIGAVFDDGMNSGILGLGFQELAHHKHVPVFDHMCEAKLLKVPQFYFSLANEENKFFVMGESKDFKNQYLGELTEVKVVDPYYWTVKLDDIKLGNKSIVEDVRGEACNKNGECRVAFDSGCTLNTLPTPAYKALLEEFNKYHVGQLPTLTYVLNGKSFTFQPEDYTSSSGSLLAHNLDLHNEHKPLFIAGHVFQKKFLSIFRKGTDCNDSGASMLIAEANPSYKRQDAVLVESKTIDQQTVRQTLLQEMNRRIKQISSD